MNPYKPSIRRNATKILAIFSILFLSFLQAADRTNAGTPTGYLEYFIPGTTQQLWDIFKDLDDDPVLQESEGMHCAIAVTASADNTIVYVDHWENGYGFDPDYPETTFDEKYTIDKGSVQTLESSNIPVPRGTGSLTDCSGSACYDGGDRIYTVGGATTVTRAGWPESIGTVYALAWELFPIKPYLTRYTIPVGENLSGNPTYYDDFDRVYVIVQSTADNNSIQIDDPNTVQNPDIDVTLDRGEVTQLYSINTGTIVTAEQPVQVQLIVGQAHGGEASETRGFTVVPNALWDNEYFSPVGGFSSHDTDLYIYNPNPVAITINYDDSSGTGSFDVNGNSTRSFSNGSGHFVPTNSAVNLRSDETFWAIGSADTEDYDYDWGFSLVPTKYLKREYFMGWAPGTSDPTPSSNGSPVFVTPIEDGTVVYVDYSPIDGTVDATFTLDRLDSQKIFDPDNNNSGMHIWSAKKIAVAWGEDPDTATIYSPYLDLGYTTLPIPEDWMDLVLDINKTAAPSFLPLSAGETSEFTLVVSSFAYSVDNVVVLDNLPLNWTYLAGSTTIMLPDGTTITGLAADPAISGLDLTWPLAQNMNPNEAITVTFEAATTSGISPGLSENRATATGSRMNGAHLFSTEDTAFITIADLMVNKSSSAVGTVNPGQTITYTIVIANQGSQYVPNIAISDALPVGMSYIPGTSQIMVQADALATYLDTLSSISYDGSDGSLDWSSQPWNEINDDDNPSGGNVRVVSDGGDNSIRIQRSGNGAQRQANTDGYNQAMLSFDYRRYSFDNSDDYVVIEVSGDGGSSWDELDRFAGPGTDSTYQSVSYDISNYLAPDTAIRFVSYGLAGNWRNLDTFYIDNIQIEVENSGTTTNPGGTPPDLTTVEDGYGLFPGETITVTFQATIDDPVPAGLSQIVNTVALSSEIYPSLLYDTATDNLSPADIGDLVWLDLDENGVFDSGESGIADIQLHLYNPGLDGLPAGGDDILITSTLTSPTGSYMFSSVPAGVYFVDLDETTLPPDLVETTGTTNPTGIFVTVAGQNYLEADFGYSAEPTAVFLTGFNAKANGDAILLTWETTNEVGLLGFNLYRSDHAEDAPFYLNKQLIPAQSPGGIIGNAYHYLDEKVVCGESYIYLLEIVTLSGSEKLLPVSVTMPFTTYIPLLQP